MSTDEKLAAVCAHPECEAPPIVGVNSAWVCKAHLDWVFANVRQTIDAFACSALNTADASLFDTARAAYADRVLALTGDMKAYLLQRVEARNVDVHSAMEATTGAFIEVLLREPGAYERLAQFLEKANAQAQRKRGG